MNLRDKIYVRLPVTQIDFESFALDAKQVADTLSTEPTNPMRKAFFGHKGRVVNKWLHYIDTYDRHFSGYRNTPVKFLEIGIGEGGSLEMWREYFGLEAKILGIDLNPDCAGRVTAPNQVRIGSQADPEFLRSVIKEMGSPNIILDDGSHVATHQRVAFQTLFPFLQDGGLYLIEDLHTSYAPGWFEGGYRRKGTGIELVKTIIDDMHAWYHRKKTIMAARDQIGAVHVYDSLVVIEKRKVQRPGHIRIG